MFTRATRTRATKARRRRIWRAPVLALTFLGCAAMLLAAQLPASAIDVSGTPSPVTGNATWFTGLGSPYGGCGLPQADLDSQNFLALNVQNSPGNYTQPAAADLRPPTRARSACSTTG